MITSIDYFVNIRQQNSARESQANPFYNSFHNNTLQTTRKNHHFLLGKKALAQAFAPNPFLYLGLLLAMA